MRRTLVRQAASSCSRPKARASVPASTTPVSAQAYTPTSALTAFGTFVHDMPATHLAFLLKHEGSAELRDIASALLQKPDLPANVREGLTLGLALLRAHRLLLRPLLSLDLLGGENAWGGKNTEMTLSLSAKTSFMFF